MYSMCRPRCICIRTCISRFLSLYISVYIYTHVQTSMTKPLHALWKRSFILGQLPIPRLSPQNLSTSKVQVFVYPPRSQGVGCQIRSISACQGPELQTPRAVPTLWRKYYMPNEPRSIRLRSFKGHGFYSKRKTLVGLMAESQRGVAWPSLTWPCYPYY